MMEWLGKNIPEWLDFFNILNVSITASWLILVVWVLRLLLKKAPKWIHVALWGLVAVRLLFPISIESSFSLVPSTETIPEEMIYYDSEQPERSVQLDIVTNPVISEKVTVELDTSVEKVQSSTIYINFIWWGGMAIMLLYTVVSYFRLCKRVQTAVRLRENIFQSDSIDTPFVLGIIRPGIYLPYGMAEQDMSYVIAHEQAHIRRKDYWWKPLGFLLLTIHWFNPLMWLSYVLLCRDIELACDEKVIKELGHDQRADYSQALLSCSANRKAITACPLAFGEISVKERIINVLNYKKPAFWIILLAITTGVIAAVCFLTNPVTTSGVEADTLFANLSDMTIAATSDKLKSLGYENVSDAFAYRYVVNFEAEFGDKVKSGAIYVEQWNNGTRISSFPGVLTEDVDEIYIRMAISDSEIEPAVEVAIATEEYGADWIVDFPILERKDWKDWTYVSYEQAYELEAKPGGEQILAAFVFDDESDAAAVDCDRLNREPQLLEEAECMIVVRAAFDSAPYEPKTEAAETGYPANIFYLEEVITLEDEDRKAAYISALEQILYQRTSPNSSYEMDWISGSNRFAIYDVDFDGNEELLIEHNSIMADTKMLIYDYDEESGTLYEEFMAYPALTFYANGTIAAKDSHNQGAASDDFWPYTLYRYEEAADTYEAVTYVDSEEKDREVRASFIGDSEILNIYLEDLPYVMPFGAA